MKYMDIALEEAKKAYKKGEVPVGAVIVMNDKIISQAHNTCEKNHDCTCHAEINAIKAAHKILKTKYLDECDIYVTLEPCAMCAAAIANSKIKRLYFGAHEQKTGSVGSAINLYDCKIAFHKPEVYESIGEEQSKLLLKKFFENKR